MSQKSNRAALVKRGKMYHAKWRDRDGRQRMRSLRTTNERVARRTLREIELLLEEEREVHVVVQEKPQEADQDEPVDQFWAWYEEWLLSNRRPRTRESHAGWWRQFTLQSRIQQLSDIDTKVIDGFVRHKLRQNTAKSTINTGLAKLQSILNTAKRYGRFKGENPFDSTDKFRIPKNPKDRYLEPDTLDLLVDAAASYCSDGRPFRKEVDGRNIHLAMALMAYAGLRKAEVCFSEWRWVNLVSKTLTVQSGDEFVVKDKDYRVIPISTKLMSVLTRYGPKDYYILESYKPTQGKYRYRCDFRKSFRKCCEDADLLDESGRALATPHMLRHSFAVALAKKGVPLGKIAAWLGHSSTSVTEIYARFQTAYDEDIDLV